ncbi:tyrosine-protein phosphatase [Lentilactobacillus sp. Marseille-Q4993]|uniref:tyrosine-protein phosphatase n=1 Tax=Lentilactobacillus sp. Marseille-Q4993 TaxID=3039492 RepID=UPI0024BCEDC0|nr:tyrosine-protein phosphatase [Lentilactobacillus sp. Marseille-Q4993]
MKLRNLLVGSLAGLCLLVCSRPISAAKITLTGADNVRDFQNYRVPGNRKLKTGLIIRSSKLSNITTGDAQKLKTKYHLKYIVDLRSPQEIAKAPDKHIKGVKLIKAPVINNADYTRYNLAKLTKGATAQHYLYRHFTTKNGQAAYRKLFKTLLAAPKNSAVLFHCSAGKDRTGFGAALILTALGVPSKTITKDYLLSNKYRHKYNVAHLNNLKRLGYSSIQKANIKNTLLVKVSYLNTSIKSAKKQSNSLTGFIEHKLKITPKMIKQLRAKYLTN